MYLTPELLTAIQLDRERWIRSRSLVRLANLVRSCCHVGLRDRLARSLRPQPAAC